MPEIKTHIGVDYAGGEMEEMLDAFLTDITAQKVITDELHDDHATRVTYLALMDALVTEIKADFNLLRQNMFNCSLGACGLAEGTDATTLKTVNAISFNIAGQLYTKAVTDNIAMTACSEQADSKYCEYLVTIDASGTVKVTKGTEVDTDVAVLPARPASEAVIGSFKIVTSGATFTSGTTDLSAANITATFKDLMFANSGADVATAITSTDLSGEVGSLTASKTALTVTT